MLDWRFRFTIAACIDILEVAWKVKLVLERRLNICSIKSKIDGLKQSISDYCVKNSVLAAAIEKSLKEANKLPGSSHAEKVLKEMGAKKNDLEIRIQRRKADRTIVSERRAFELKAMGKMRQ